MTQKTIELEPGELITLKEVHVKRGNWSMYTGELVLTNRALTFVDRGVLGNFRGYIRIELIDIQQVFIGKSGDGKAMLEIYHSEGDERFAFKSGGKLKCKSWLRAVQKQTKKTGTAGDLDATADVEGKLLKVHEALLSRLPHKH